MRKPRNSLAAFRSLRRETSTMPFSLSHSFQALRSLPSAYPSTLDARLGDALGELHDAPNGADHRCSLRNGTPGTLRSGSVSLKHFANNAKCEWFLGLCLSRCLISENYWPKILLTTVFFSPIIRSERPRAASAGKTLEEPGKASTPAVCGPPLGPQ